MDSIIELIVHVRSITLCARHTDFLVRPKSAEDWIAWVASGFQPQAPFQEFHLLTEPPAGGTEAEFVHGSATV
jgi:hypothetical protein